MQLLDFTLLEIVYFCYMHDGNMPTRLRAFSRFSLPFILTVNWNPVRLIRIVSGQFGDSLQDSLKISSINRLHSFLQLSDT